MSIGFEASDQEGGIKYPSTVSPSQKIIPTGRSIKNLGLCQSSYYLTRTSWVFTFLDRAVARIGPVEVGPYPSIMNVGSRSNEVPRSSSYRQVSCISPFRVVCFDIRRDEAWDRCAQVPALFIHWTYLLPRQAQRVWNSRASGSSLHEHVRTVFWLV